MKTLLAVIATSLAALAFAAAPSMPSYVSVPVPIPPDAVNHETYGRNEFTLRDKTEIHRGKYWKAYVDYADKLGEDTHKAIVPFIESMRKAGWDVVMQDIPSNPPYATFHYTKNGKDAWAHIQTGEQAKIIVVESGPPAAKLDLAPPAKSGEKVGPNADFPYLKHFPGSKLVDTVDDDSPMLVAIDADKDPVQVASGAIRKTYDGPAWIGDIEPIVVYDEALQRAGWKIIDENVGVSISDPYLIAHYAKDSTDIWVNVHSRGNNEGYMVAVADAGAERSAAKVKAELDKTCKVQVYGINFDFDKSTLRADSEPALRSILQVFNAYPDLALELAGHTDNVGKPDYNARLSEARVNTVRGWLVGKGVKAERISAKGYGDTQPIATNDSPEGRAKNRRVELRKRGCAK